ncbi:hypothetical protein B0H16DRAFT_1717950 [Mycena metata]|uniref:BTB domain-containing protein n=1 Tax=Mycena metata TaxID=1033252 RepID=A0AAD7JH64_9AGAR|nr:hypothetical protein B0H16DRAFT_1717950 [Mycena metata]
MASCAIGPRRQRRFKNNFRVVLPPSPGPHRVEKLWFRDGTLVLTADNVLFRVYGGLLAQESLIFEDMLRIPQPPDAETVEGCPVVHLPDNGRDVEYFLKALFDYKFFPAFPSPTTFDIIAGILRLSKKYEVDSLHRRALVHFASGFPMTAAEYPPSPSWTMVGQALHSLVLARELALDWVLPAAFYRVCAHTSIDEILNGIHVGHSRVELDSRDKLLCLEQIVHFRGPASAAIVNFLWEPEKIDGCQSNRCRSERLGQRKIAEGWRDDESPLTLWENSDWDRLKVCSTCLAAMKITHETVVQQFWDNLPQKFGLAGWDELKEMKAGALAALHSVEHLLYCAFE